ncbi:MAG: hypothetical protein V3W37_03015 [Candidatus Binatia bacterium]
MWNLDSVRVGDYVEVEVVNKYGDRNLDGMILKSMVTDLVPTHNMARLNTGWCIHTKDRLVTHTTKEVSK